MRWFALALILTAGLAAAQNGDQAGYLAAGQTECWDCHAPNNDDRPMDPAFAVDPGRAALDGDTVLRPRIVNTWYAQLSDMSLEVDLTGAPGISFLGGKDPQHNETRGQITVQPSSPLFALQRHGADIAIDVPPGATALRIQLIPDDASLAGPDLAMSVTDAVSPRPFTDVDDAGPGGSETLRFQDASGLAAHGSGQWTLQATMDPARADGHIDPHAAAPFAVAVDAWFNTSLERVLVLEAPGPILPGNAQPFAFDVVAAGAAPGQAITFTARARLFYEHGDANPDEALVVYSETFRIGADASGTPVMGTQAYVAPIPKQVFGLDSIAEAVGYGAAFLLLASLLSGGILGKRSRRAMNRLFGTARRRVAFHNFLSYGILAAAFAHLILFIVEIEWHWAWGLLWGGLGILSLFALGFTGALQVPIIRRWGFASWRWIHFGMAIAAVAFTVIHILLDGSHFEVRDAIAWQDPLVPKGHQ